MDWRHAKTYSLFHEIGSANEGATAEQFTNQKNALDKGNPLYKL